MNANRLINIGRCSRRLSGVVVFVIDGLAVFSAAETRTPLTGHLPAEIRNAALLKRAAADERIQLSLVVRLDPSLIDQTIEQLYGRRSAARKHFLSSAEFAQKFGLADKRNQLKNFAATNGLSIDADGDSDQSMIVKVSGPASTIMLWSL